MIFVLGSIYSPHWLNVAHRQATSSYAWYISLKTSCSLIENELIIQLFKKSYCSWVLKTTLAGYEILGWQAHLYPTVPKPCLRWVMCSHPILDPY